MTAEDRAIGRRNGLKPSHSRVRLLRFRSPAALSTHLAPLTPVRAPSSWTAVKGATVRLGAVPSFMSRRSTKLLKAALSALHYTGADGLIAPFTSGNGVIFMLHHVTPEPQGAFSPNGILKVTPEFLETVIQQVKAAGFDCISLDDVPERIARGDASRPFAVFTLDDGYKDNREHAYPIFKRYGVPFTIYVPSSFADGTGDLWWLNLEEALRRLSSVTLEMNGTRRSFDLSNDF